MSTLTAKYGRKFYKSKDHKEKPQLNNQLSDSLAELFKISRGIDAKQKFNESIIASRTLPRLREDTVDGVDHINFFSIAKTELGSMLSPDDRLPFKFHSFSDGDDGVVFSSLKNLWAYYRSFCLYSGMVDCTDYKIRKNYRLLNMHPRQHNIFAVMVLGYYCKLLEYPVLAEAVKKNNLPFDYYREIDGVKDRLSVSKLLINGLREVRHALLNNTKPRLEYFLSEDDSVAALAIDPELRFDYITKVLFDQNRMREVFKKQVADWSEERLESIAIPVPAKQQNNPILIKMDQEAAKLNVPLAISPEEMEEHKATLSGEEPGDVAVVVHAEEESADVEVQQETTIQESSSE